MNVEIDYLIETTEKLPKRFEGSGEVELGIVLLCALKLFENEKAKEEARHERVLQSLPSRR